MKRWAVLSAMLAWAWVGLAHVGNPNIIFEGRAGAYPVRVIIRPPTAVPGLAEILVRSLDGRANQVTVLPLYWKVGKGGAPRPDEAARISGESDLFQARLWLMTPGAYSVKVGVTGPAGNGVVLVPVNSMATARLGLPPWLGFALAGMGLLLFVGAASVAAAAIRESVLAPGEAVSAPRVRFGRIAALLAVLVLTLALYGGSRWWGAVDAHHAERVLFKPPATTATVIGEGGDARLRLEVHDPIWRNPKDAALIPDHGHLMHLFLVRDGESTAFAHLHPTRVETAAFESAVPPLPAGRYHFFADVTYESGFAVTLTNVVELLGTATGAAPNAVGEGSWRVGAVTPAGSTAGLGEGLKMQLEAGTVRTGEPASLRVRVTSGGGRPAQLQPWLGMLGHAVVMRDDGSVFSHVHPAGTISMASQRLFTAQEIGEIAARVDPNCGDLEALPPAVVEALGRGGEVSFPYAFPIAGDYTIWVQVRVDGKVRTGAFLLTVDPSVKR